MEYRTNSTSDMAPLYEPIRSDSEVLEMRLVEILPADQFDAQLELCLKCTNAEEAKPFEALSYTWGTPIFSEEILLNGQLFKITSNLKCALQYLRKKDKSRKIWIDAICINQSDSEERKAQVTRMREIYVNCERDILWLGDNPEELAKMMNSANKHFKVVPEASSPSPPPTLLSHKSQSDSPKTTKAFKKLRFFFLLSLSPVWKRVWIMQELCSAPKIVLQCGYTQLDWRLIEILLEDKLSHQDNILSSLLLRIEKQRKISSDIDTKDLLIGTLTRFRSCLSTDPRDRVFGLLGLARNDVKINVNYEERFQDVFINLTKRLMEPRRNLDILIDREWLHFPGRENDTAVPSWTLDLRYPKPIEAFPLLHYNLFRAGRKSFKLVTKPSLAQPGTLHLAGRHLGNVPEDWTPLHHGSEPTEKYRELLQRYKISESKTNKYVTGETRNSAFWCTVVADCEKDNKILRRIKERALTFNHYNNRDFGYLSETQRFGHWSVEEVFDALEVRWHFTVTDTKLFAMIPKDSKPKDLIVVLDGSRVPIALRPFELGNGNGSYKIVGGSYVHGFMDGEAYWSERELGSDSFLIS